MRFLALVPLRRQGPISDIFDFNSRSLEIATAEDGPLPSQGHGGYLERGK
jgi:hypothetical protein